MREKIWFNTDRRIATESQRKIEKALRQEVDSWQNLVRSLTEQLQQQQAIIDQLSQQLKKQQERTTQLEAQLREQKKLKGRPKIRASQLNEKTPALLNQGMNANFAYIKKSVWAWVLKNVDAMIHTQSQQRQPGLTISGTRIDCSPTLSGTDHCSLSFSHGS